MKKHFGFVMAVAALVMLLSWSGSVFASGVGGDSNITGDFNTVPCNVTLSTGGDLWTLLQGTCGGIPEPVKNAQVGYYVLVTGRDCSSALYSVGELDPTFGNVAVTLTSNNKGGYDLAGGGRTVHNVSNIDLVHAVPVIRGGNYSFSSYLIVSGAGITPETYNLTDLQEMTPETYTSASGATWTGPTLANVLHASGIDTRDMNSYVVVQATDAYAAVLSMYEATHMTGTQYALLAISASDNSINKGGKDSGLGRLVLPNDNVAGRWVSNVAQIVVYELKVCDDH